MVVTVEGSGSPFSGPAAHMAATITTPARTTRKTTFDRDVKERIASFPDLAESRGFIGFMG